MLGDGFLAIGEREVNMPSVVEGEVKANTPVLMCAAQGFDASARIDDLAAELNKAITSIAIGSAEGFSQAEKAINSAVKNGRLVDLNYVGESQITDRARCSEVSFERLISLVVWVTFN